MGVVTDVTVKGLTTAVTNISATGMSDTTGQAIVSAINGLSSAISPAAANVTFDNTGTGMTASNVQALGVEVYNKANSELTFTPVTGMNVNYRSLGINNKMMMGNIEIVATATANTLTTIGTLSVAPETKLTCPVLRVNGTYTGMVWINTDKTVQLYSTQALSGNAISFQFIGNTV